MYHILECLSVNYNDKEKVCEYVNATTAMFRKRNTENLKQADGWTFFDTKQKSESQTKSDKIKEINF